MQMKLEISDLSYEAKDYKFGDATLTIRPLILTQTNLVMNEDGITVKGQARFDDFNFCLTGWKNVVDENGKDLPCTEEVKKKVFDFGLGGISNFVLETARVFKAEKEDQEKNL